MPKKTLKLDEKLWSQHLGQNRKFNLHFLSYLSVDRLMGYFSHEFGQDQKLEIL